MSQKRKVLRWLHPLCYGDGVLGGGGGGSSSRGLCGSEVAPMVVDKEAGQHKTAAQTLGAALDGPRATLTDTNRQISPAMKHTKGSWDVCECLQR